MSKEQQAQAQPQVAIPLPKEKCRSARMHLHDAFRSNVRSCICNTDIPDSEKR